jgi:potassium efflux system protein
MGRRGIAVAATLLFFIIWPAWLNGAATESDSVYAGSTLTPAMLESRIAETEAAADLSEEVRGRLVELYRKALSQIEVARAHEAKVEEYRRAAEIAPAQTEELLATAASENIPDPLADLPLSLETPLAELKSVLEKEQAKLGAVTARQADFEARLAFNDIRPTAVNQRLAEATAQREAVAAQLQLPPEAGMSEALLQAQRWVLWTEYIALSTEIKMLDQELLTRAVRMRLLEAKRDRETASIGRITTRVEALNALVNRKRQQAAAQARVEAEQAQRTTVDLDPRLQLLSERNAAVSQEINAITDQLQALDSELVHVTQLNKRIDADFADVKATVASGELSDELGAVLQEQRRALPDLLTFEQARAERRTQISNSNVQRLRYLAEARRLADLDGRQAAVEGELDKAPTPLLRKRLRALLEQRQTLVGDALEAHELYLTKQRELAAAEDQLLAAAAEYGRYLKESLLWLRSQTPIRLDDLRGLPAEVGAMLDPAKLRGLMDTVLNSLLSSPVWWLALGGGVLLRWLRRPLCRRLEAIADLVGKPTVDSIGLTLRALILTALIAAPLPLIMITVALHLMLHGAATELSFAIGGSLLRVATVLYLLLLLKAICKPRGLAAAHFRWPVGNIAVLRRSTRLLIWLTLTVGLAFHLALDLSPTTYGGTPARLLLLAILAPLIWCLFRIFHPRTGVFSRLRDRHAHGLFMRTQWLWYPLLLLIPAAFAFLGLAGYMHTVEVETIMYFNTLLLILVMVLVNALAMRWLMVARQRLAYEAALERRRAALEAARQESETRGDYDQEFHFEPEEVDLSALSGEARELIRTVVSLTGLIGLYLIWADALPALRILDDVVLWHSSTTVDDVEQLQPITVAAVGLALLYGIATWLLASRLPALIEIVLLRRFDMAPASRYTVTTLTTYVVFAVGILLVLSTLGARWSQVQWLAAALTVGIGFGLQEIVANFVSGLIILFERPIRVGDTITVGETDGMVTKINIRATTIRNWDGKELLVPNKEFITGRLLNWSLSDPTTRLVLSVGVAYGSPVRQAMDLMEQVAQENNNVLDDPAPSVIFQSFGDNALGLSLRCFVGSVDKFHKTASALNEAINEKFTAAGITIAFPQRDIHLATEGPLRVRLEDAREGA